MKVKIDFLFGLYKQIKKHLQNISKYGDLNINTEK